MKEVIVRCAHCRREDCDGEMWIVPKQVPDNDAFEVCTSETFEKEGQRYYNYVMGHGARWDVLVTKVVSSDSVKDMNAVATTIMLGEACGLLTEIIWSAMNSIKDNPDMTVEEACFHGVNEWIK